MPRPAPRRPPKPRRRDRRRRPDARRDRLPRRRATPPPRAWTLQRSSSSRGRHHVVHHGARRRRDQRDPRQRARGRPRRRTWSRRRSGTVAMRRGRASLPASPRRQILAEQPQPPGDPARRRDASGCARPAPRPTEDGSVEALTDDQIDSSPNALRDRGPTRREDRRTWGRTACRPSRSGDPSSSWGSPATRSRRRSARCSRRSACSRPAACSCSRSPRRWTIRAGPRAPARRRRHRGPGLACSASTRARSSIAERVPAREADPRTEVGRVGEALNTLLDHVDASLDARQRNEERMRRVRRRRQPRAAHAARRRSAATPSSR